MMGIFSGWRRSRLNKQGVEQSEIITLQHSLWQSHFLPRSYHEQLVKWSRILIAEKYWEGCDGLSVSQEMQWKVAAQAGLMVLGYPEWHFDKTASVLLYPRPYVARETPVNLGTNITGIVGETIRAGETGYRKPVILNWNDVQLGSRDSNNGSNLVIHEFAHQLDLINGPSADGLPPLPADVDEKRWWQSMKDELAMARSIIEQGHHVLIDDYGLTHESEFFAVASELYFQTPNTLATYHPNVFELLKQFYRVDLRKYLPA